MINEDDFDMSGIRWECQGCADKFGISKESYRENSDCRHCEYSKTYAQILKEKELIYG